MSCLQMSLVFPWNQTTDNWGCGKRLGRYHAINTVKHHAFYGWGVIVWIWLFLGWMHRSPCVFRWQWSIGMKFLIPMFPYADRVGSTLSSNHFLHFFLLIMITPATQSTNSGWVSLKICFHWMRCAWRIAHFWKHESAQANSAPSTLRCHLAVVDISAFCLRTCGIHIDI